MKFLMLGIVNTSKIVAVTEYALFGERCLKLALDDGGDRCCTHILTGNGDYVRIDSIGQFYKDLISEDKR